jgi:hypothetical protein
LGQLTELFGVLPAGHCANRIIFAYERTVSGCYKIFFHGDTRIMRIAAHTVIVTTGVIGLIGSALAAEMTGADIKTFLSGNTAYLKTTAASASGQVGNGVIYWKADGTALYKRPLGGMMHGKWAIKGNALCAQWKERPGTGCVRYDKTGDAVTVMDVKSRKTRAKIVKVAPGNAENLTP